MNIASYIDHTLLKLDATEFEIQKLCQEALKHNFSSVCVNTCYMNQVVQLLKDSPVKPIAVVGFPLGACTTATKAFEAREAIQAGAQEIDMVMNIAALKNQNYAFVFDDIREVVQAAHPYPVKVILETASLSESEKIIACALAKAARAAFVKTSTGFGAGGATVADVELMRRIVGPDMGVKASGGVRTYPDAIKMIQAGADRIGSSNSVQIVEDGRS